MATRNVLRYLRKIHAMNKDDLILTNIDPLLDYFNKLIPLNAEEKRIVADLFPILMPSLMLCENQTRGNMKVQLLLP